MTLHHYIVVRRDLPFGVVLAMVAHAAGESFYKFACPSVGVSTRTMASGACAGPGPGMFGDVSGTFADASHSYTITSQPFDPAETIAVVLGARNEGRLQKLAASLDRAGVQFVEIKETDGEHAGQLLALGIVPTSRGTVAPLLRDFHMLKELGS